MLGTVGIETSGICVIWEALDFKWENTTLTVINADDNIFIPTVVQG